jgi:glutamate-1-semialdehyde 2,1-aminomutase
MKQTVSRKLFAKAITCLAGGVNSPVRCFKAVGGDPLFVKKGKASRICDADNQWYVDYVMSWGALILGHAYPEVISRIKSVVNSGTSFGASNSDEVELAGIIKRAVPSMEKIRLVNSGTEAVMSSLRLARGYTRKNKIIKFEGCYHGHCDSLLVKAGSGAATLGIPDSLGVTASTSKDTIVLAYNNIEAVRSVIRSRHRQIAAVIVEPVAANMGVVIPNPGFLLALRELTAKHNIVLIFDEVICGFRFTFGAVQSLFGIHPDLTCLGKIIGGGMPLAAYGGRKEIMDKLAPLGGVYQAGTLSGNPVAVNCGLSTLKILETKDYARLNQTAIELCQVMEGIIRREQAAVTVNRAGSIWTIFFTPKKVIDFSSAKTSDTKKFKKFFWAMLKEGIYLAPSQFEGNFLSFVHTDEDFKATVKAFAKTVKKL